jgi:hypothetical protein
VLIRLQIPGVDEAMSFAEVLKQVKSMSYEVIIFDTAPTGHTLRFLQFPTVMEKALSKVSQLSRQFGPMLNTFLGASGRLPNGQNMDEIIEKMEALRETIAEVNGQFKDADLTTFVCVCIPEFLSLYETERMIQELNSYEIDTHSIVVNQLLYPKKDNPCEQCNSRRKMQKKYLDQIEELYDEFNVIKMPLLVEEVRGKEKLEKYAFPPFGQYRVAYSQQLDLARCSSSLTSLRSKPVYQSLEHYLRPTVDDLLLRAQVVCMTILRHIHASSTTQSCDLRSTTWTLEIPPFTTHCSRPLSSIDWD